MKSTDSIKRTWKQPELAVREDLPKATKAPAPVPIPLSQKKVPA